eukprot:9500205-Pyramimonas_sp.AAC.1
MDKDIAQLSVHCQNSQMERDSLTSSFIHWFMTRMVGRHATQLGVHPRASSLSMAQCKHERGAHGLVQGLPRRAL